MRATNSFRSSDHLPLLPFDTTPPTLEAAFKTHPCQIPSQISGRHEAACVL